MPLKYIKASLPHLNLATKILLVIAIIGMCAFAAFAVRMSKGPMDLDFAKTRLEAALSNPKKGYEVKINKLALTWPDMTDAVLLDLNGVQIVQEEITGLNVDHVSLGLSGLNLLRGKILPSVIIVDSPTFQLVQQDGSLNFFWQDKNKKSEQEEAAQTQSENPPNNVYGPVKPTDRKEERLKAREMRYSAQKFLSHITDPNNSNIDALAALKRFELKKAVITGQDSVNAKNDYLAIVDLSLHKNNIGLEGKLNVSLAGAEGNDAYLRSDVLYRRAEKDITFTADVKDINPARYAAFFPDYPLLVQQNLMISGAVKAAFDEKLRLQLATLNLSMPEGNITIPNVYEEPVPLKDIAFEAQLNRPEKTLNITRFDANVGGIALNAKAEGKFKKGNITAPVELKIADLPLDNVPPIFPKSHLDSGAGEWLTHKLSKGHFKDIVLTTDFHLIRDYEAGTREAKMTGTKVTFNAEDVTVRYSDTLMPVTNVFGEGVYENDSLVIKGEKGIVGGDIHGTDVTVKLTDLSVEGGGLADISLNAKGPLKTALKYVSDEPIAVADKLGFDVNQVKGNVDFHLQLNFPTVKDLPKEEVVVVLDGKANDIVLPNVVKGLSLTGGPYDLGYKGGAITLKGKGQLDNRPIDLDWLQYFDPTGHEYESKIIAKITADEGLRQAFGIGLEDYISGPLPVDVTYIDKGVKATIDVTGDLTPSTLHIDPFKYKKPEGTAGELSLKVIMNGQDLEEVDNLQLKTKGFSLGDGRLLFRKFKDGSTDVSRGNIPKAIIGKTEVAVDFEITPENLLKATASGAVVDMAPFINTEKKPERWNKPQEKSERPMHISVSADKMLGDEGEALGRSKLYFETDNQGDITRIEMDSKVGSGDMYLRFKPEEGTGKRTFRLESSDAGHTLKVFGLYDKVRGGTLVVYGQPEKGDLKGNLFGTAKMENFEVKGAPVLAKLLSVMSLAGVQNLLNNEGLMFAKLESEFEWRFRDEGNLLVMKDGRTSGSSIGLTFEGLVNQANNTMDVSGTIIPVSGVNKAISEIPLIGNILTGGDALIAATYTISGPASDAKVAVNPLSVLAPGFLRKIFFETDVESKIKKAK